MIQPISSFLNRVLGAVFDRYDFFISYARADAADYAVNLQRSLRSRDFACFLDKNSIPAGDAVTEETFMPIIERGLKRSKAMILVGTENAIRSFYVSHELESFLKKRKRRVIAVNPGYYLTSNLDKAPFDQLKGLAFVEESREAIGNGQPSVPALAHIEDSFNYDRRRVLILRYTLLTCISMFTLGLIVGLIICSVWPRA